MSEPNALYSTETWELALPAGWIAEFDDEVHTVCREDGVGALQIGVFVKDSVVTVDDLEEFSEEDRARAGDIADYGHEGLTGISITMRKDSNFWRLWFLRAGSHMFYVTYNCDDADRNLEIAEVEHIVGTLRMRPAN